MHNFVIVLSYFWLAQSAKSSKTSGSCIFIYLSLSNYLPFNKISSESKYRNNPMWGTLENWKLLLSSFTTAVISWNLFTQRKLPFKIEFKYILFHKPAFQRLMNSSSENATIASQFDSVVFEGNSVMKINWLSFPTKDYCGILKGK